jgi:hypothetical protein
MSNILCEGIVPAPTTGTNDDARDDEHEGENEAPIREVHEQTEELAALSNLGRRLVFTHQVHLVLRLERRLHVDHFVLAHELYRDLFARLV